MIQFLLKSALFASGNRRQKLDPGPFFEREYLIGDVIDGLPDYLSAADRAMRNTDPRIEEAEIIVNLGNGADGGAGISGGGLLIYRNSGRQTVNERFNSRDIAIFKTGVTL